MKKILASLFLTVFIVSSQNIKAQTTYYMNLDSAIAIAMRQSYSIRMLTENMVQAKYQLRSVTRSFLPKIDVYGNLPDYSETMDSNTDSLGTHFFYIKKSTLSGSLQISQTLPTDGKLSIISDASNMRDIGNKVKNINTSSRVQIEQPLRALYAYNSMQAKYKNAKLQFELAAKQYKRQELDLVFDISEAFYTLILTEKQKEIAYQNLQRQQDAYTTAKNKYEAGVIKEVEALQIEVDLGDAVNQYDVKTTAYIQQANVLKQLLGLSLKDSIVTTNKIEYNPVLVDPQKAVDMGLANRTELRERNIAINLTELQIKQQKAARIIGGDIIAYYKFIGNNYYSLNYNDASAFQSTFNDMMSRQGNRGIALSLEIPILDWGANRSLVRLRQSQLKQNKYQLENQTVEIEKEIRNKVNNLQSNLRRLVLLEKNIKLAEKSYNISYQRFSNGDIDAESLALDRVRYTNAQQSYLQAYINYKLGLLDLNRSTFFDFEHNTPIVSEEKM